MTRITFKDVGRNKLCWAENFPALDEVAIVYAVKKKGALMSSGIDVEISDDEKSGLILVGDWRPVGGFTIEEI